MKRDREREELTEETTSQIDGGTVSNHRRMQPCVGRMRTSTPHARGHPCMVLSYRVSSMIVVDTSQLTIDRSRYECDTPTTDDPYTMHATHDATPTTPTRYSCRLYSTVIVVRASSFDVDRWWMELTVDWCRTLTPLHHPRC